MRHRALRFKGLSQLSRLDPLQILSPEAASMLHLKENEQSDPSRLASTGLGLGLGPWKERHLLTFRSQIFSRPKVSGNGDRRQQDTIKSQSHG